MPRDLLVCLSNELLWSAPGSLLRTIVASPSSLSSGALVGSPRSDGKSEASSHDDEVNRANPGKPQGTLMLIRSRKTQELWVSDLTSLHKLGRRSLL